MALYHVRVRTYYWGRTLSRYSRDHRVHTPVQSPVRLQGNDAAPYTVRLLSGEERLGVHLISHDKDLTACREPLPYLAEAHGVIVRSSWQSYTRPIWVVQEEVHFEPPFPVKIVDLVTNEVMGSDCPNICWVPHLMESDGTLLTILNDVPGELQIGSTRTERSNIITQVQGRPEETKAEWVETRRLSQCRRLGEKEKEALFNAQLESLRSGQKPSSPPQATLRECIRSPIERLLASQDRLNTFADLSALPDEDLAASDRSFGESLTGSSDWDDEDLSEDPFDGRPLSTFEGLRRPCCTYPDLAPTLQNPAPRHRHLRDQECPRGSDHADHCIFTDLRPAECFLQNHQHCHLLPVGEPSTLVDDCPIAPGSSLSMALELAQLPTSTASQCQVDGVDEDEDEDEDSFRSVCDWPLVPDLDIRLHSPPLVDHTLESSYVPDMATPYEPEPSPSPYMMDIDEGWMPADEEGMMLLQHGLPPTPPPSCGMYV